MKDLKLVEFPVFLQEDNFCDCLLAFHCAHSQKGFTLKGKNLLPGRANSSFLKANSFQKGGKNNVSKVCSLDSVLFPLKALNQSFSTDIHSLHIYKTPFIFFLQKIRFLKITKYNNLSTHLSPPQNTLFGF